MSEYQGPERRQVDLVSLVAAITRIETNLSHLTEDIKTTKQSLDVYVVDHRGQHLEDRQLRREEADRLAKDIDKSVQAQVTTMKAGRRIYVGMIATLIGAILLDAFSRLLDKGGP